MSHDVVCGVNIDCASTLFRAVGIADFCTFMKSEAAANVDLISCARVEGLEAVTVAGAIATLLLFITPPWL